MDIHTYRMLDATELHDRMKNGALTPEEAVELSFRQLQKVNPTLNAVVREREEKALQAAASVDKTGAFSGVPLLLKDISQGLKGELLTSGSKLMKGFAAEEDSYLVQKLKKAGFIVTGHTNVPEFALKNITEPQLHGPTRNPWNTKHSPGGSSGGAAAAVASGIVPVAGASDGGGSIRIPASFTSLFGLKPTRGRTPVGPGAGRQWQGASIDFALSRTVRDSAGMLDSLQVVQPEAAFQTPLFPGKYVEILSEPFTQPLKIAYTTKSPVGTPVSADAERAVHQTVQWLENEGHIVCEVDNGVDGVELMRNYFLMNSGEVSNVIEQMEKGTGRDIEADDVETETWLLNVAGRSVSAGEFSASLASWDDAAAKMEKLHQTYDFYLTPATAYTAPEIGELTFTVQEKSELVQDIAKRNPHKQQGLIYEMFLPSLTYTPFSQLANLTGQPAMSLPVHLSDAKLPLGVQFMASKGMEHRLLQLAYQVEQSKLWVGMKGNPYFKSH